MKRSLQLILQIIIFPMLTILLTACSSNEKPKVYTAVSDNKGGVWVGTKNGIFYRAAHSDTFQQMPLPSISHHPFPAVYALCCDSTRNRLWIGAWNHLYCYDLMKQRFIIIRDSTIYQTVGVICDTFGCIKVLTGHGQYSFTLNDTLADKEYSERLDSTCYSKPEYTNIDTSGWLFEQKQSENYILSIIVFIITIINIMTVTYIFIKKIFGNTNISKKHTVTTKVSETPQNAIVTVPQKIEFIDHAKAVVEKHLSDEDFNTEIFAQEMAVSRAQLFRKLKANNGQTPKEFIDELRMAYAANLLATTDRIILDIATCVGYNDTSNFRRTFMKHYGKTPSEWRKEKRNNIKAIL